MLLYNSKRPFGRLGLQFLYMGVGYNGLLATIFVAPLRREQHRHPGLYSKFAEQAWRRSFSSIASYSSSPVTCSCLDGSSSLPRMSIIRSAFRSPLLAASIVYMILTVNIANSVEYNEYRRTSERARDLLPASLHGKNASALQQGFVTLVLVPLRNLRPSQKSLSWKPKSLFRQTDATEQANTSCIYRTGKSSSTAMNSKV